MRFKIDENLHTDAAEFLRHLGHDAMTVYEQNLGGHPDAEIADSCRQETRALITLDLDFANIRAYPPSLYPGLVVLRLADQSRPSVLRAMRRIAPLFDAEPLAGHLWIVDERQVRIRPGD
ncbi:DUF5615 family PIN-like protein [Methylomagnum ishizawai]|uniref:DUF5615 family PIN-like protein n=1 Tax=Methylomagnum ishizawai TaxID=1760988 RepID=UPI001C3430A1|nr:DUF5615 family PIN-like protein [Methylomagnum ishizawai]BBL73910.1 hypothetical protein MishRS11D_10080 [Methylomagnum ishizawai]